MRRSALAVLSFLAVSTLHAAPVVFSAGPDAASVTLARDAFRAAIGGGTTAGANGSFGGVRREINWDGVPDASTAPNNLPADFFNVNSPRGVVFSTPGTGFQVSANAPSPGFEFDNLNPAYPASFQSFSPQKLFTPLNGNVTDVNFFTPGTATAATVSAFGAVFTDVDVDATTSITFFDLSGTSLGTFPVVSAPGGLSFLGVQFTTERVARVRIVTGNAAPGPNDVPPGVDVVVMDDFIYSEPLAPSVSIDDAVATEGTSAAFTVSLNYALPSDVTVVYGTADGTAQVGDADYTGIAAGTTATIAAGATSTTITVDTTADAKFEADETFFVDLASAGTVAIADARGVGTIVNDDAMPSLSIGDVTQSEGDGGTSSFVFTVTLAGTSATPVSVGWATADGTASSPEDYASAVGNLVFAPGETTKTITIAVAGDAVAEPDQTFFVNLLSPSGATTADAQGVGTILNDDAPAAVTAVPTLSEWLVALLAMALAGFGVVKLR